MDNTGDDALMAVVGWGIRHFFKTNLIYAMCHKVPRFEGSDFIKPILVTKTKFIKENGLRVYYNAARAHNIVFGGGSVFVGSKDLKVKINMLKLAGKGPHTAMGVGIGPFRDAYAERICAELLKRLSFIGLRDQTSLDIATSIAPGVRAEKTFDLAVLLPHVSGLPPEPLTGGVRKGIGLALCNYERFTRGDRSREQVRVAKVIQALKQKCSGDNEEVVLIDFNGHPYFGDHELHAAVASEIGKFVRVRHICYSSDPIEVLKTVSGLRALVAMRLHAAVFGYMVQIPTIILSYHPKCRGWAQEIGMPAELFFDSNDFDVEKLADALNKAIARNVSMPALPIVEAEKLAMKNWEWTNVQS